MATKVVYVTRGKHDLAGWNVLDGMDNKLGGHRIERSRLHETASLVKQRWMKWQQLNIPHSPSSPTSSDEAPAPSLQDLPVARSLKLSAVH